jgi:tRNA-specific 2-thiouridylase
MRHGAESTAAACEVAPGTLPVLRQNESGGSSHKQGCCTATDAAEARRVASRLSIPFYALDLQREFDRVVKYFVDEYTRGRTPNPCVRCNDWIKFGRLFDYADSVDAAYVATGHYARIQQQPSGETVLLRGLDETKDQSYALFGVKHHRLSRMLLPVGEYRKTEIRRIATELGLAVATKKDSQEICFVAAGKHADLVRSRRAVPARGEIVTTAGRVVGQHEGVEGFTIGQRKGLGVALGDRQFVIDIDARTNRVVIGDRAELGCSGLVARELNWLGQPPAVGTPCAVQVRYNSRSVPCIVESLSDQEMQLSFQDPYFGVAPGQAAVLYSFGSDRVDSTAQVLGGGWITERYPTDTSARETYVTEETGCGI